MVKRRTVVLEVIGSNPLAVKLFENFFLIPKMIVSKFYKLENQERYSLID